jgi:preprotein translocase subunit SecB
MAEIAGLNLINFEITKVLFDRGDNVISEGEFEVNIQHMTQINDDNEDLFRTVFIINITGKDNYLNLSSPSIIYPYLRAYISNITLQSGMNPITIPPMNFAENEKKEAKKKSSK